MSIRNLIVAVVSAAAIALAMPLAGAAQSPFDWDPRSSEVTRSELQEILERLEAAAGSPGYSEPLRAQARRQAEFIRNRLDIGDFQVGDRVVLWMQSAQRRPDTLSVQPGRVITLPDIGEVSLDGVLRSELQTHLETELARYVQNPEVRVQTLIRIAVLGAVGAQGFYAIPADALVEEAFMIAGGPAEDADIDGTEIRRGEQVLLSGQGVQQAITEGRTLDQINLRAGDRIVVPGATAGIFSGGILQGLLTIVPTVVLVLTRL